MARWTSAGSTACSSRFEIRLAVSLSEERREVDSGRVAQPTPPKPDALSYSSGRAVPTSSNGTPSA